METILSKKRSCRTIMPSHQHSIRDQKEFYQQLFDDCSASDNTENFIKFLKKIVNDVANGLQVDLDLLDKDLQDETLCKARRLGALESLRRTLLAVAEGANYKASIHPDWSLLAGRLEIQRLKLNVPETFAEMLQVKPEIWRQDSEINYLKFVSENAEALEAMIVPERDYDFYFFGIRTLEKSYLAKLIDNGEHFLETPQRLYLRIAAFLWMPDLNAIKEYYDRLSTGKFTHASPTMFHSGIAKGSLASCFLLSIEDDLSKIFNCLSHCAQISKAAGGIGLDITKIRHSQVGHMGQSSGIVPMLKVFDATMRYVDQGGRRKGSATIFLQPWHIDFLDFLQLKRQHGTEESRVRDLFYAVWSCDLFMERVEKDKQWTMFCPKIVPELNETFGEEFEKLYLEYEKTVPARYSDIERSKYVAQMPARDVWFELITTQIEAGMPFMAHKDTANNTSNQQNLGLIRSSNLCMEITEVTDGETISSCNLASIALDEYVDTSGPIPLYDFAELGETVRLVVQGINRVIDRTFYPLQEKDTFGKVIGPGPIKSTNLRYRPTGIGVQALADAFLKMNLAWTDKKAHELNRDIFATIYYYAVDESCNLARKHGAYDGFQGSPASRGLLKPDLIALERARKDLRLQGICSDTSDYEELLQTRSREYLAADLSPLYDWQGLREKAVGGMRNSLLVALMPTASSAQIRYKNESFEPFTTNLYVRSVLAGNHLIINRYMVDDLQKLGLWNPSVINHVKKYEGSIANIPEDLVAPEFRNSLVRTKEKCKTSFELSQKLLLNLSIDRSYYVCQSQSLNVYKKDPTFAQLGALHMYAWKNALTTGMYYLRTAPSTEAIQFTVEGELDIKKSVVCSDDICLTCQA